MKKLLVLMLVLGMASLANATLQISVDGDWEPVDSEIFLMPSDTVILDIWTDAAITKAPADYYTWALIVDTQCATITGGVAVEPWASDDDMWLGIFSVPSAAETIGGIPESWDGIWGGITIFGGAGIPANSLLYDEILFHCESAELKCYDTVVELWRVNNDTFELMSLEDSVIIHQIPEPMTIALLGLGGLFLRRRK